MNAPRLVWFWLVLISALLCGNPPAKAAPEVEWMVPGQDLSPTTTMEVRFVREMVGADQLGVAVEGPLVFQPALPGKFTWLSRRSGVFVPSAVPPLNTVYEVGLRAGLADAAGRPFKAKFKATLRTPPFQVVRVSGGGKGDETDQTGADPSVGMFFNRNVQIEGAAGLFSFQSADGKSIAAKVSYGERRKSARPEVAGEGDWEERWKLGQQARPAAAAPEPANGEADDEDSEENAEPQLNVLWVRPVTQLTAGQVWRLEMKPGVSALATKERIAKGQTVPLGFVQPFTLTKLKTSSYLNSGRSVELRFSEYLGPDVDEETAGRFFHITPEVPELRFEPSGDVLDIRGRFDPKQEYRLEIDAALLSNGGMAISGERVRTLRFGPVRPRVYLPAITTHQFQAGQRKFPVTSVNLKELRVVARLVAPEKAAEAVAAFGEYAGGFYDTSDEGEENNHGLPADAIGGKVIAERKLPLADGPLDGRQETILDWNEIVGRQAPGVVFLTIEGEPRADLDGKVNGGKKPAVQALIQITDLGLLWKRSAAGLALHVFSMATGTGQGGVRAVLLDKDFKELGAAQSAQTGEAVLKLPAEASWLALSKGSDAYAVCLEPEAELPTAAFHVPTEYGFWPGDGGEEAPVRMLIFTDRPLYRPGEKVHIKGLVRTMGDGGLAVKAGTKGTLTVTQPNERGDSELAVQVDERGAFEAEWTLDASAVGRYGLRLKLEGAERSQWQSGGYTSFQAADFQPNAFELKVAAPARFGPGQAVAAEVSAGYFFGSVLENSPLRWTLQYRATNFFPEDFADFSFDNPDSVGEKSLVLRGEGKLDGRGALRIEPKLPELKGHPAEGVLTVEVTDVNQQTVSETRHFERDAAEFYLGLKNPDEYVLGHDQELVVRAVALRPDGKPLEKPVAVKVELIRQRFSTVRVPGAGGAVTFRSETSEEKVAAAEGKTLVPVRLNQEWRLPEGQTARFKPGRSGQYRVKVTAQDSQGRVVAAGQTVSVSGEEAIAWGYRNAAQIDLVADKTQYRPGDTARVMVKAPFAGEALLSIERGRRVLRSRWVKLEGNAPVVEVPLEAGDGPNVCVSLVLLRGANQSTRKFPVPEFRYGLCELQVNNPATQLTVHVRPVAPAVQPGEEVAAEVHVVDGIGAAVADAEVTFFAVDDGILALTGYERPEPQKIFGAPVPLGVRTGLNLFELLSEDPADLKLTNKGYLIGGGGMDGPGPKLRKNFPGTACWLPSLRTGADGKVTARFSAPDALTRYRLVAVVHAGADRFGSGESSVQIRKKLMLLSGLGQAANAGDEILVQAVVRNEAGAAGQVEVSLTLDGTAEKPAQALTQRLDLAEGKSGTVQFPVKLREPGTAAWQWVAQMEAGGQRYQDALEVSLKVGWPAPELREIYLSELFGRQNDLLDGVNPQLVEGSGTVRVSLANTRLASLREPAKELLTYPYGCLEQTVSAMIPWIAMRGLGPVLPDLGKSPADVRNGIEAGVAKIFGRQTGWGGIAFWPGGHDPDFFGSAYAAVALGTLQKQGERLPQGWEQLLKYLRGGLAGERNTRVPAALAERALALYALALAGKPEPAFAEVLFQRRADLTPEGRALLALALVEGNGQPKMIATLLDDQSPGAEEISWFGSASRERAVRLLAWIRFKPADREVSRLAKELLAARVNGRWRTTQENAWALLALSEYFTAIEGGAVAPVAGSLSKAGGALPFALDEKKLSATSSFAFDPAKPLGALTVVNPDKGRLYGETAFVVRPPVAQQPRQDRGYAVSRSYHKLGPKDELLEAKDLKVGDRVLVTLRVETPVWGHFVAIDDPLPGVLEALNPEFRTSGAGESFHAADYREIRADRVVYFCNHMAPGIYQFQYLARVRGAGKVMAPAVKVEEMYRPERFGLSATATLEARPLEP